LKWSAIAEIFIDRIMKYIGIDYGTKRIGIAVSNDDGTMAFPRTTIAAEPRALSEIVELIQKEHVQKIIVGESRTLAGQANEVQEDIEQFKKDLAEMSKLPVEYEREFFTSSEAARQFAPDASPVGTGLRPRGSRKENPSHEKLDASAAALILQSYLDKQGRVQ
jgi:putative Holliday junction resolvase